MVPFSSGSVIQLALRIAVILSCDALFGCVANNLDLAPEAPDVPFKPEVTSLDNGQPIVTRSTGLTSSGARDFSLPPAAGLPLVRAETLTDDHVYSLADLIDLAQMNNPETRVAWDQARQAAAAVGIARALYLPVVTATVVGGYQHLSAGGGGALGGTGSGNASSGNLDADVNGTVSSGALQWLLFDFGVRDALTASARNQLLGRNIAFNGAHQKIIYDVSRAFFDYSSARQAVALTAKARGESAFLLEASQGRFKQGLDTAVEVAQARRLLAQADFDLVKAQGGERDAYHTLVAAVGISPTSTLHVLDVSGRARCQRRRRPRSIASSPTRSAVGPTSRPASPGRGRRIATSSPRRPSSFRRCSCRPRGPTPPAPSTSPRCRASGRSLRGTPPPGH